MFPRQYFPMYTSVAAPVWPKEVAPTPYRRILVLSGGAGHWAVTRALLPLQAETSGRQRERVVVCYDESPRLAVACESGTNRQRIGTDGTLQERRQPCP